MCCYIFQAQHLMDNLKEHVDVWRERRQRALSHLQSALGDSCLVAGCTVYYGLLTNQQREIALQHWKKACYHVCMDNKITILYSFVLINIFVSV